MEGKRAIFSISICGRVVIDMHSLNNEGGEGNQIATRMVNMVNKEQNSNQYRLATVNAISGDMFKHIQTEHLYLLAKETKMPLCKGCHKFSPSRVLDDLDFVANLAQTDSQVIDALLRRCVIDDLAGNLIAKGNRAIPRKSVAEFGWAIGLPDYTTSENYFHVRYAMEKGEQESDAQQQAIFHRPANSGVYAIVSNFEIARIGFNDIAQQYAIDDEERKKRYLAFMESILYTFIEPNGAMRGTQNPHIVEFEGVLSKTSQIMPAPTLSPINQNYREELKKVVQALESFKPGAISLYCFNSMSEFTEIMKDLIENTEPYKYNY